MARPKGTPNKDVEPLKAIAKQLKVDPFQVLLLITKADWKALGYPGPTETKYTARGEAYESEIITLDQRRAAASDACQYLYPKRKAIEINEHKLDATVSVYDFRYPDEENDPPSQENAPPKEDRPIDTPI